MAVVLQDLCTRVQRYPSASPNRANSFSNVLTQVESSRQDRQLSARWPTFCVAGNVQHNVSN
jgi:hypothetical protein